VDYPTYDPQSAVTPLTEAELQGLDQLLGGLPVEAAMSLDGLDGYLTALLVAPGAPLATWPTAQWLPLVWGGDGEAGPDGVFPFASKRQRKNTVVLVLRHLRHLAQQFSTALDEWQPIFSVAEQGEQEWADARDWCAGFMQAVDLAPQAWAVRWAEPALSARLAPLVALGGGLPPELAGLAPEPPADLDDDPEQIDQLSRIVPDVIVELATLAGLSAA
jgi:uncharacterized protein